MGGKCEWQPSRHHVMYHWHCVQCRNDEYIRQNSVREAGCAAIGILHGTSLLHSAVPILLLS